LLYKEQAITDSNSQLPPSHRSPSELEDDNLINHLFPCPLQLMHNGNNKATDDDQQVQSPVLPPCQSHSDQDEDELPQVENNDHLPRQNSP